MSDKLTEKQKIFCREYIYDWNATRAYKIAYPNTGSDKTAASEGCKFLRKPNILEYIEEIQKDIEKQAGISRMMVVNELMKMAFSDIADIIQKFENGGLEALTDSDKKAIAQFKKTVVEGDSYTKTHYDIKAHDKKGAIELLNKMLGYNEPEKHDHKVNVPIIEVRDQETKDMLNKLYEGD